MSEHVEKAKKYLAETGWPATHEALDEELTRVVYLLAKVVDEVDTLRAQLSEAQARLADESTLIDWLDTQRQDILGRDNHGNSMLICHAWGVHGQCGEVRTAIRMEMRAAGLDAAPVAPAAQVAVADDVVLDALRHIAVIAHEGGRINMSDYDALVAVRQMSLPFWTSGGTVEEANKRLRLALLAAQQQKGGAE